jgi:DNA-binding NtrC family response regulator
MRVFSSSCKDSANRAGRRLGPNRNRFVCRSFYRHLSDIARRSLFGVRRRIDRKSPGHGLTMNASRPLLYFNPQTETDLLAPALNGHGWTVHVANHPDAAAELMQENDFLVGMVHWDALAKHRRSDLLLDKLDQASHINWIALLSDENEPAPNLARILSTHFYDYHTLPADPNRLLITLGHAYGMAKIVRSESRPAGEQMQFEMVGRSPAMQTLFQGIRKVGEIDLNVMIRGESGTGKELTAQAIHRLSHRSSGPFVAVNCGALPKDLIQAELFGHEKGSFTGADRRRVGRIEAAQGGTLFLDEIGDLPLDLQVNLLRFLQEKTIDRVGSSTQISVDVRVIAATHVNLERAVEEGRFREDLYYRLNVLHLDVPPLREREEDIELLAMHFFDQCARKIKPNLKGLSQQAIDAIRSYPWPGNVREMVNRIQRAVVMCEGRLVKPRDLGLDQDTPNCTLMTLAEARAKAEKEAIESTLGAARNNVSKAARRLDISRVTLYRLMEQHAIEWQRGRSA